MPKLNAMPIMLNTALLGEKGVVAVQKIAPSLGFIFRDVTKSDFGIDAQFERFNPTNDPTKYHVSGRLLAIQIKCGESVVRNCKDTYNLTCTEANINYWLKHSLPVIVIYCDPKDEQCYWVAVTPTTVRKARANWVLSIPKSQRLEDAQEALCALANGVIEAPPDFHRCELSLELDEDKGLRAQNDEEVGLLCSEFIASLRRGEEPTISVTVSNEEIVRDKIAAFPHPTRLSIEQRKERLAWIEIERRYNQKRDRLQEGLSALLRSEEIGRTYFWQMDYITKGQAIRQLFSYHRLNPFSGHGALTLDVFPARKPCEPCVKVTLSEQEKDSLLNRIGLTNASTQLISLGYQAFDLPRDVFSAKFLPALVFKCQVLAELQSIPMPHYLETLSHPLEAWSIGLS